jgi:hypothetical protein
MSRTIGNPCLVNASRGGMTQYQANGLKSVIVISPATSSESTVPPIDTRRFMVMIGLRSVWIAVCMIVVSCCSRACWA